MMRVAQCERHDEVLAIARSGGWPDRCDDDLVAHAATCVSCGDLVVVASAIGADFNAAVAVAQVPPSGAVWFRAQRRARHEAEQAARRTITALQSVSVAAGVVAAVGVASSAWTFASLGELGDRAWGIVPFAMSPAGAGMLIAAAAALIAAAPVALVLALRD